MSKNLSALFGVALLLGMLFVFYKFLAGIWGAFVGLDKQVAVSVLTACTTIFVATLTVMLGRHLERKREIESHFRNQKIEMYDNMLQELFKVFTANSDENDDSSDDNSDKLVEFLIEWQRKMVLWGGAPVLSAYLKWKQHLSKAKPDAKSFFLMDEFFRAMRKDIGLGNSGLAKGAFAHLILKNGELFLQEAKKNPNITLEELAEIERRLGV